MTGARMQAEMAEQPALLRRLVVDRREEVHAAVRALLPTPLRGVVLIARGSSDNAATHARYVLEAAAKVPVGLAAPSLQTRYGVEPRLHGFLAIAVSQSGATPEIITTLEAMHRGGAACLAVTNVEGSPLQEAAEAAICLQAGPEQAVPATKTVLGQLAALCLVAEAVGSPPWDPAVWPATVDAVAATLEDREAVRPLAQRLGRAGQVLPIGRGYLYGAALEVGLKLAETTGQTVRGTSPADLRHGPIATVDRDTLALCLAAPGPAATDVIEIAAALRDRGAALAAITEAAELVPGADPIVPVPAGVPEALVALPHIVRGQQLALEAALLAGVDPDTPFRLTKVTPTS